jgi:hypothetical protein
MAAPTPRRPTIEVGTEPAAGEPVAPGQVIGSSQPVAAEPLYLYVWANPDHPGGFSLKDPNGALERAFTSLIDPTNPNLNPRIGAPVCPACDKQVAAYPIETEGDIPDVIKNAPY